MRVLISGSSGLIGSSLLAALEARGDQPVVLVRPASAPSARPSVTWDPETGAFDREALDALGPIDAVVHLAGAGIADKRWSPARKREIQESRSRSTSLLARQAASWDTAPRAFVSGSAIGIYGDRGDESITEASAHGTGFLAEVCVEWERSAAAAVEAGIRTVFARTGIVLSTEGGALGKQLPLFRLGLGGRLGSGSQWTSWISIEDEVDALLWLLDASDVHGPVNLTAPAPVTNRAFTAALGHALHRPTVLPVPPFALRLALGSELVDEALLASQKVLPAVLTTGGFEFSHPSIDDALVAAFG